MSPMSRREEEEDENCCHRRREHTIPGPAILRCNAGSLGLTRLDFERQTLMTVNQPIASVTIDTELLRCPTIKVDFSGILSAMTEDTEETFTFNFTLFKTCKCTAVRQALQSFVVPFAPASEEGDSTGLSFVFSQCEDQCDDCCTFTLELTSVSAEEKELKISFSITGTICVLAVASRCN